MQKRDRLSRIAATLGLVRGGFASSFISFRRFGGPAACILILGLSCVMFHGCEKEEDILTPDISVSGVVANYSGIAGTVIVEIDYDRRDVADAMGKYSIVIHRDYVIDSLYAWVDQDGNDSYTPGEPFGFYHSTEEPDSAKTIHARNYDVTNINFAIPEP